MYFNCNEQEMTVIIFLSHVLDDLDKLLERCRK